MSSINEAIGNNELNSNDSAKKTIRVGSRKSEVSYSTPQRVQQFANVAFVVKLHRSDELISFIFLPTISSWH